MNVSRQLRALLALIAVVVESSADPDWADILNEARGQTVYWNAWGGDARVNRHIAWAAAEAKQAFGIEVRHVKLADTADAVSRVLAEKSAGRTSGGSVDLLWVNGENFAAMKEYGLLYGPFVHLLPNHRWLDTNNLPLLSDFTVPADGLEAPWSVAQLVLLFDLDRLTTPPRTPDALLAWARAHPGRFAYPRPPDFLGTTFLKQLLLQLTTNHPALGSPATAAEFQRWTAPLWRYLDALHPHVWRQARAFPGGGPALVRLLADAEVDLTLAFSPEAAASGILSGQLPGTARTTGFEGGSIGNVSFLAIPFNSRARSGALVLANFLLSPVAQARKQDPSEMGARTVLAVERLDPADRDLFERLPRHEASPLPGEVGPLLPEPHPYWMDRLEQEWERRYGGR